MSSRSSAGAIVFVVALVGIGLFAAYRAEQKASDTTAPASAPATAGSTTDAIASAPARPAGDAASSSAGTQPATAEAPVASGAAENAGAEPGSGAGQGADVTSAAPDAASFDTGAARTFELEAPTYDVVRVEPTGDAVIAGRASPGATIELDVNGQAVGSTRANEGGEWVIVLERPLAPGDYDIALKSSHENAKAAKTSTDRLAVSIPTKGDETPLVALSRPNAPVEVLQKPAANITQAASGGAPAPAPGTETAASAVAGKSDRSAVTAPTADGAAALSGSSQLAEPADGGETVIGHLEVREDARPGPVEDAPPAAAPPAADPDAGAAASASSDAPAAAETAVAADGNAGGPPPQEAVPVTIEIAEAEGDTFRLQGRSKPGADIWIYLAGEYVGEAQATEAGRWSFEAKMGFEAGDYSIRVDQIANRAGAVATRAEVPFAFKRAGEAPAGVAGGGGDGAPKVAVLDETEDGVRVLIRRGDNLWTIAHHFYGDGFSYASIYRENNGQIRNPHLIYPGQVFVMPGLTKKDITDAAKKRAL